MKAVMKARERSPRRLLESLQRKQRKHRILLARVEKTAARLERRKIKLQRLETGIADLESRLAEPRKQIPDQPALRKTGLEQARLIFNPSAGGHDGNDTGRLAQIVSSLLVHGIQAQIRFKTSGGAARKLAREAVRSGLPLVVVAAGDSTIEEVASQLVGTSTVLGIVPIGTMNNLSHSLGVPLDIDEACALIGMGTTRHIDIGRVFSNEGTRVDHFLEGAGVGLSAIATLAGEAVEKWRWRLMPRALHKFFESKPGNIHVEVDDTVIEASSRIVTVSNAPLMGKNILVAPEAKMDDGLLDVAVYDGMGEAALVKHFMAAAAGTPGKLRTYRARRVRIVADVPLLTHSDKDVRQRRHIVEIEVVPRALSMIVGNGIALTVPVEAAGTLGVDGAPANGPTQKTIVPEPTASVE